jgi:hypothetical protein
MTLDRRLLLRCSAALLAGATLSATPDPGQDPVVVMPLGYGGASVNGDGTGIPPKGAGAFGGDAALYERDLLEDIIPMIDSKYRTVVDREHRAIVSLSMGGRSGGPFRLTAPGHVQPDRHHERRHGGRRGHGTAVHSRRQSGEGQQGHRSAVDRLRQEDTAMKATQTLHHALEQTGIKPTFLETAGGITGASGAAISAIWHQCCSSNPQLGAALTHGSTVRGRRRQTVRTAAPSTVPTPFDCFSARSRASRPGTRVASGPSSAGTSG